MMKAKPTEKEKLIPFDSVCEAIKMAEFQARREERERIREELKNSFKQQRAKENLWDISAIIMINKTIDECLGE